MKDIRRVTMNLKKTACGLLFSVIMFMFLCQVPVYAETYYFNLEINNSTYYESAVLTATDTRGNVKWTYRSPLYPQSQFSHFALVMNDHGSIYLVEDMNIKAFDFYTGKVKWVNYDFRGHPTNEAYAFSDSDKLYISGYYGPDLFVVDADGKTVCRVEELDHGSWWIDRMFFSGGDNMTVHFSSNDKYFTFNVLDYFKRRDGLTHPGSEPYNPTDLCRLAQLYHLRHEGYYPPLAHADENRDGTCTIHLFTEVDDGLTTHTSTSAWYTVDSYGIGKDDTTGKRIDLSK